MKILSIPAVLVVAGCLICACPALPAAENDGWKFHVDFAGETPGAPPASAAGVGSTPGSRVMVVDADTDPADPFALFAPAGNRSLMLENNDGSLTSHVEYHFPDAVPRGALEFEFLPFHGRAGNTSFTNPMLQLWLRGTPFYMYIRANRFIEVGGEPGADMITLEQRAKINEPNRLLIVFNLEDNKWHGWLNGDPLSAGGEERFALSGSRVTGVYMRPGSSKSTGGRFFVNFLRLTEDESPEVYSPPGMNMLPNADFSQGTVPREIYPAIGDYRWRADSGWNIDSGVYFAGGRSLRMAAGSPPFFWQVLDNQSRTGNYQSESVFSVYIKSERPGQQAEIGYEVSGFSDGGLVITEPAGPERIVELDGEWRRFELAVSAGFYHGMRMHRAWVRPVGEGAIWVDAAQLENDRMEASLFDSRRLDNNLPVGRVKSLGWRQWVDPAGPRDPLPKTGAAARSGSVALRVLEISGTERPSAPVRGGVPFPEGELFDAALVRLVDAAGREMPAQFTPLAHWGRDCSIRSLGLDFQADLEAGASADYQLVYGAEQTSASDKRVIARDRGDAIEIDTGVIRAVIRKNAFRWFDEITDQATGIATDQASGAGSRIIGSDGQIYSSCAGPPDEIKIEDNGPLRATVMVRGRHFDGAGVNTLLHYEARIHAFAGKPYFILEHAVENPEPQMHTPVESISLRLPLAASDGVGRGRIGLVNGNDREFSAPFMAVQRQQHDGPSIYDSVLEERGVVNRLAGVKLSGWLEWGGAALAVYDFWQMHPAGLAVDDALVFYHWPRAHVRMVDLPYGVSMHAKLVYAPFGADDIAGPAREMPLLHVDPAWVAASGVFESFIPESEAVEYAPGFEERLRNYCALIVRDQDTLDLTGKWNYGCNGTPQRWGNNETTVSRNLWMQWLRGGDPRIWRRAWISTRHIREIDICYAGPGARAQHYHFAGTHHAPHFGTGHYWITGLVWHYLLTGDRRSLAVARDAGAMGIMESGIKRDGRQRSRTLYVMAELYELTRLQVFREAFERQYAFGVPTPVSDYHGGKNLMLMAKWHEATGDAEILSRLQEDAARLVEWRTGSPPYGHGGRSVPILATGLSEAARVTGNPRYVDGLWQLFYWSTLHPTFDINALRLSGYLYQARRLGVGGIPGLPHGIWGLACATGRGSTFHFRAQPRAASPAVFNVHRIRQREGGYVRFQVTAASGDVLSVEELGGPDWSTAGAKFEVDRDGSGPFDLSVQSFGDDRLEISSSGGAVLLAGDTVFRMRQGTDIRSSFRFYLRAPVDREDIEISLQWPEGRDEGAAAAALLETPAGEMVAHARWVVPMGTMFDATGAKCSGRADKLVLHVPPDWRGRVLRLYVFAPTKDLRWRVRGLEYPWLAIDADVLDEKTNSLM